MSSRFVALCCILIMSSVAFAAEPPKAANDESPTVICTSGTVRNCTMEFPAAAQQDSGKELGKALEKYRNKVYVLAEDSQALHGVFPFGKTCLTMRSYVFRRDTKNSDATRMSTSRTCTPTFRFQLKPAQ